ncbi:hypothetical protein [Dyadobacter sandarakinus]|uniref:Uncharacterized protein n=1 Tax=Dyadobacter sandarakinus TaxID=2747268 RepID=A0ABX7I0W9_9BACT|nr:hypothetical protein [Dyadobacter sandarakinus]QRQ99695.1 hypothetical protein HWI92_01580 [Dyadobacter sandarakinus]
MKRSVLCSVLKSKLFGKAIFASRKPNAVMPLQNDAELPLGIYPPSFDIVKMHRGEVNPWDGAAAAKSVSLKPLSELHKDKEACKKIHEHLTYGGTFEDVSRFDDDCPCTTLYGYNDDMCPDATQIEISDNGTICYLYYPHGKEKQDEIGNVFALVDFIRSLGYSA